MTATAEAKRTKAALILAKKLDAAAEAMDRFVHADIDCGHRYPEADDQRRTMPTAMREYAGYLESVFQK